MSIPPIEVAAMAPKSQEVSHYKHQESQKSFNEQMQMGRQFNSEIKHNNQQAVKTTKSDNNAYRYDAKEKGNTSYSGSKQKKKKKDKDKEGASRDKYQTSTIDIKI